VSLQSSTSSLVTDTDTDTVTVTDTLIDTIIDTDTPFCAHEVTIIDTPGQEIFYRMRNYGAAVADIGVLVVACNDGICAQTQESIGILEQLQVPIMVALNKTDHPAVTPDR
jgi:translation initiation factor IF-2